MGQTVGKACIHPVARPFTHLPKTAIYSLKQCVDEVAEGFGLSIDELKQIIHFSLQEYIRVQHSTLDKFSEALFALFGVDAAPQEPMNGGQKSLIDSFEFLSTMCIVSGMQLDEKIYFIFDLFDINESGYLHINEATLAFRLLASGTSKISSKSDEYVVDAIDRLALKGFECSLSEKLKYSQNLTAAEEHRINKQEFFHFVFNCSETISFLGCFDDIAIEERPIIPSVGVEAHKPISLRCNKDVVNQPSAKPWRDTLRSLPTSPDEETIQSTPSDG